MQVLYAPKPRHALETARRPAIANPAGPARAHVVIPAILRPAMSNPSALRCPHCGAPVMQGSQACGYCRVVLTAPGRGDAGRDQLAVWSISDGPRARLTPGPPRALRADVAAAGTGATASRPMTAPGVFDDLDVSVTIQFVTVNPSATYAGFEFRAIPGGSYRFVVSANGQFRIGTWVAPSEFGTLVPWTFHPALRTEPGALNRIRLIAVGKQIRVELNDAPASSVTIQQHYAGNVSLYAGCEQGPLSVVFTDLVMRDPRG